METEKKISEVNTEPLISIVVPIYNIEAYLSRCLDSILEQQYHRIEIIAVDDGSSDRSGDILDEYAKLYPTIRAVHKKNGGVTSARLRGVAEASGEWIGFVDGDDEIEPDMYERLLHNALKYKAEISHCGYQMVSSDGSVHCFHNTGILMKQRKTEALKELLSGERIEPGLWNKLFHKTLCYSLLHDKVMPLDVKINEDLLMNYYLFSMAEQTVFEDWCPYHYIVRSTSASRTKLDFHKIYDPIRVKNIIRQEAEENIQEDAQRAYLNTCINLYHTLLMADTKYRDNIREIRNLLRQEQYAFHFLGKKRAMMARLIIKLPALYKPMYFLYYHFFQRKVYF